MRRSAMDIVLACLRQAKGAIDGQPDIRGVFVFLSIVLPPAHWAQSKRIGRFQRLVTAAGAAKTGLHQSLHMEIDGIISLGVYPERSIRTHGATEFRFPISAKELV